MHIRDATIVDIPRLVDLWLGTIGRLADFDTVYPWRISAPEDFRTLMVEQITDTFLQGQERYLVVETQQQIIAWTSWARKGSSEAAQKIRAHNRSVLKSLERQLRRVEKAFRFPFFHMFGLFPIPTEGPTATWYGLEYGRFLERFWSGNLEEHWFMKKLCVDRVWQRHGIGMMLVQWGLDRAQEEGVVVGLDSTEQGMALYRKAGFVQVGVFEVWDPDMSVPVLLWRPKTVE